MDSIKDSLKEYQFVPHYHGDVVRVLFFVAGIIMLIGLPFFKDLIPFSLNISILSILVLGLIAGFTNPRQMWVAIINVLISLAGFIIFEYYAVTSFDPSTLFFWTNQALALIFFLTLYFSTKTLRGFLLRS